MHGAQATGTATLEPEVGARAPGGPAQRERFAGSRAAPALIVGALTVIGVALRVALARQSLFGDELSSYWVIATNGLGGVVSTVHTDVEITPPFYFVLAWLATRIDLTPELLRAPSVVAGGAAIPVMYLLGLRTVGRVAALVAAALTALSPFMIFYSSEARGYALMVLLVMLSTLALLIAVDDRRPHWWIAYGVCSCAAVYTHYTSVFVLATQLLWLVIFHPEARKPALLANAGAVIGFAPWFSGLVSDMNSPTTTIVDQLNVITLETARVNLSHWAIGHPLAFPNAPLRELPGHLAVALIAIGVGAGIAGLALAAARAGPVSWLASLDRRLLLVIALAVCTPLGEALISLVGTNEFGSRYFAASWPALGLVLAALLLASPGRWRIAAVALAVTGFAINAGRLLEPRFQRPDYNAAADYIDRHAGPRDVVIDGTNLSPAPFTALDVPLERPQRTFYIGRPRVEFATFKVIAGAPPAAQVTRQAVAAARGGRIYFLASETVLASSAPTDVPQMREVIGALPPDYRRAETHTYPGVLKLALLVYEKRS